MGTEGTITMPDGEDVWVTSGIDNNWNLGETAHFPMVRIAEAGMNLYEMDPWDVHGWVIDRSPTPSSRTSRAATSCPATR